MKSRGNPRRPVRHAVPGGAAARAANRAPGGHATSLGAARLLDLQRTAGNRAVTLWLQREAAAPAAAPPVAAKGEVDTEAEDSEIPEGAALAAINSPGWLNYMRPYFGSDEVTLAHFAKIREVRGHKGKLLLHDELASTLESVQDKLGVYPRSTNGWSFRGHASAPGGSMGHAKMHQIGGAVDFDTKYLPMLNEGKVRFLIEVVTGRQPGLHLEPGGGPSWKRRRDRGDTLRKLAAGPGKKASAEENEAFEAWKTEYLDRVDREMEAFAASSKNFMASLGPDGKDRLHAARSRWREAQQMERTNPTGAAAIKKEVKAALEAIIKPWIDAVDRKKLEIEKLAATAHIDLKSPRPSPKSGGALAPLRKAVGPILKKLKQPVKKKGPPTFGAKEVAAVEALAEALKMPPPEELTLETVEKLDRAAKAALDEVKSVNDNEEAFGSNRQEYALCIELRNKLVDEPDFIFGANKKTDDAAVTAPSPTQLVTKGFYRFADPDAPDVPANDLKLMITKAFVKELIAHEIDTAAAWDDADSMHFEYPMGWRGHDAGPKSKRTKR